MSSNELKKQIAETVRLYHSRGWSPATSTNYSFKDDFNTIWVSRSGVDKSQFTEDDFITVNTLGEAIGEYASLMPSAETLIHCVLYDLFPETKVILHSHSVYPVIISAQHSSHVKFEGFEIQKGFAGQTSHEGSVTIPIFDNTQDMQQLKTILEQSHAQLTNHSFILRKHGTYAWGKNLFEAKRHLETLEYLCEVSSKLNSN